MHWVLLIAKASSRIDGSRVAIIKAVGDQLIQDAFKRSTRVANTSWRRILQITGEDNQKVNLVPICRNMIP